jgi:hypothetical protein
MFCASGLVFDNRGGIGSSFHVILSRTHFLWYVGRLVPFSYFALPNSFSTVLRVSGAVFMFCVPELVFGVTVGIRSLFHVVTLSIFFDLSIYKIILNFIICLV